MVRQESGDSTAGDRQRQVDRDGRTEGLPDGPSAEARRQRGPDGIGIRIASRGERRERQGREALLLLLLLSVLITRSLLALANALACAMQKKLGRKNGIGGQSIDDDEIATTEAGERMTIQDKSCATKNSGVDRKMAQ